MLHEGLQGGVAIGYCLGQGVEGQFLRAREPEIDVEMHWRVRNALPWDQAMGGE